MLMEPGFRLPIWRGMDIVLQYASKHKITKNLKNFRFAM